MSFTRVAVGLTLAMALASCGHSPASLTPTVAPPPAAKALPADYDQPPGAIDVWVESASTRFGCHSLPECDPAQFSALRARPLQLPGMLANGDCPATQSSKEANPATGPGLGDGPVYPVGRAPWLVNYRPQNGMVLKVLWIAGPDFVGPALIRGHQLDGGFVVRFWRGDPRPAALAFPAQPELQGRWKDWPSGVEIGGPGCYGIQIDTNDSSTHVVFLARLQQ